MNGAVGSQHPKQGEVVAVDKLEAESWKLNCSRGYNPAITGLCHYWFVLRNQWINVVGIKHILSLGTVSALQRKRTTHSTFHTPSSPFMY